MKTKTFDIAANLANKCFEGDLLNVIKKAKNYGVEKMIFAGTYLKDSLKSQDISLVDNSFYFTVGIHPCRAKEPQEQKMTVEEYFANLENIIKKSQKNKLIAIGECGLDYDRFSLADKETQLKYLNR